MRSANDPVKKQPKSSGGAGGSKGGGGGDDRKTVGNALRNAYDEALAESIPDEMLDLLKKLD